MIGPRLSVITLTYNRAELLEQCLGSVTANDVDAEFIVYDDASTDGTQRLMTRFNRTRDPRIRYFRQPFNVGFSRNAADAFACARGEYVCSVSDDDLVLPGNFERKVAILDANPGVGLVYSLAYAMEGPKTGLCWRPEYAAHSYVGRYEFQDLLVGNYIPGPSAVWRREFGWLDPRLPDTLSDWDLWLRCAYGSKTAFIAEPLVTFRHGDGQSVTKMAEQGMGMIQVWAKWVLGHDAPVVGPQTWAAMREMFTAEVKRCGGEVETFERLYAAYLAGQNGPRVRLAA